MNDKDKQVLEELEKIKKYCEDVAQYYEEEAKKYEKNSDTEFCYFALKYFLTLIAGTCNSGIEKINVLYTPQTCENCIHLKTLWWWKNYPYDKQNGWCCDLFNNKKDDYTLMQLYNLQGTCECWKRKENKE